MDPATAAGFALAAIPLLISAVENYETTFQPFVTYYRHIKEVQRFTDRLDTQRTIFSNECQLLMLALGQNLNDILRDPNHPSRSDEALSNRLKEMLGSSYRTCISTLNLINDTLGEITEETRDFRSLLETTEKGRSRLSLFRQKLKISFSKTRLNDIVDELRGYNDDLCKLSRQIRELTASRAQEPPPVQHSSAFISHFRTTRQASARLYDALASKWSCDDHVEHIASISLKVEEQCRHASSKVRFNLALSCRQQTASHLEPLWLAIESAPSESAFHQKVAPEAASAALEATLQKIGATGRTVRFELPSMSSTATVMTTSTNTAPRGLGPQLDLYSIGKLCRYFNEQLRFQVAGERCIGFLERTRTCRHFVYPVKPKPHSQPSTTRSKTISLKQVLYKAIEERRREDWVEKLRLAKLLSLAVLRFSNEWIPESWSSNDVYFYNDGSELRQSTLLDSPYTNVPLSGSKNNRITTGSNIWANPAPNAALFNLGVVLIELGYDAPFENLRQQQDNGVENQSANNQVKDFFTARRLGESMHKQLNMTYRRLVEKCLMCNFGVTTKLEDVELQSAVLVHVVNELETCLKQYNDFNSLASVLGHI